MINGVCILEPNKINGSIDFFTPANRHGNRRQSVGIGRPIVEASTKDEFRQLLGLKRQFILGIAGPSKQIEQTPPLAFGAKARYARPCPLSTPFI
jgi:hypothetical protein